MKSSPMNHSFPRNSSSPLALSVFLASERGCGCKTWVEGFYTVAVLFFFLSKQQILYGLTVVVVLVLQHGLQIDSILVMALILGETARLYAEPR
jgi:hypothetical protein